MFVTIGEMAEWSNALAWKAGKGKLLQGFESLSLRQKKNGLYRFEIF